MSQEGKDLIDETEDADNDIDPKDLLFIDRNRKNFNFNIFGMSLSFLSAIYNGEMSLKEAEISQRKLEKKIEELKFGYRPENAE